jgi:ParB-like partition proteins
MALPTLGLGKGLDALIRETSESRPDTSNLKLAIKDILPNPKQPRKNFDEKALAELAESIRSQGLLQPILVRPVGPQQPGKYEIVAGERRWRACQLAGLTEAPVFIRSLSEQDTLTAALIENLQREDLNPMEEAIGLQSLKDEFGLSQDELAKGIGKSRSAIANSLRLLSLAPNARQDLADGKLSAGHARTLLSLTTPEAQEELRIIILEHGISVREAEALAAIWKERGRFDLSGTIDAQISPERTPAPQSTGTTKKKPQSRRLLEAQNRIGKVFQVPVRVTGKESKGKISFSYNSREELEYLLEKLYTVTDPSK